jgi:gamma-glutamyl-gamma-aminobutyrate hydrolase PuuD
MRTICPDDHTPVSSLHNFAVEHVAVGFIVTATSHEDSIEAIESDSGDWLAVGIQCVPQSDTASLDLRIFRAFVQRVAAREPQFA